MLEQRYREQMERVRLDGAAGERILRAMTATGAAPRRRRLGRAVLAGAAACALLAVSALAYVGGVFDFLRGREEYRFLGQAELYEQYAVPVGLSDTAPDGDALRVDYVAMDENFCTVFYTLRTVEALPRVSEWSSLFADTAPELWQSIGLEPQFRVLAGGETVSSSYEARSNLNLGGQRYLADEHTLYGMVRMVLTRPVEGAYTLCAEAPLYEAISAEARGELPAAGAAKWSFALTAQPLEATNASLPCPAALGERNLESLTLSRSPLGTVLRARVSIPEAYRDDPGTWGGLGWFVLRDPDSGRYFPYASRQSACTADGAAWDVAYEIFGDLEGVNTLEVIPATLERLDHVSAPLEDLPLDAGGGYTLTQVRVGEEELVASLRPEGIVGSAGACGQLWFLDGQGEKMGFYAARDRDVYVSEFTDWRDGSVTITYSAREIPPGELSQVAGVAFGADRYTPLWEQALSFPLE